LQSGTDLSAVNEREILAMRVVVANQLIEDDRVEQRLQVNDRSGRRRTDQLKTLFDGGSAFILILVFRHDSQRLAKILLVST